MHWLAPWSLVGLVLVPAALVWGLLWPRGRRTVVATLLPWKRALGGGVSGRPAPRLRLKTPLLWLDAALLALLVLACARPAVERPAPGDPVATVVVDRTASLLVEADGTSRAEAVAEAMARLAEAAGMRGLADAPVRVLAVPPWPRGAAPARLAEVTAALCEAGPVLADGDALATAVSEAAREPARPVLLLTDVRPVGVTADRLPPNVRLVAPGADTPAGTGLTRVSTRIEGPRWWLLVAARAAKDAPGPLRLKVRTGGARVTSVPRFVEPGATIERVLAPGGAVPDRIEVHLEGGRDGFAADEAAYLVRRGAEAVRVALVGEVGPAVRRALAATGRAAAVDVLADEPVPAGAADVVIAGGVRLPPGWAGPAVLIRPPAGAAAMAPADGAAEAAWRVAAEHPLAEALYLDGPALGEVPRFTLAPEGRLLVGTPEAPLVATWEAAGVRRMGIAFDPAAGGWPRLESFPVFWARAIDWLAPASAAAPVHVTRRPGEGGAPEAPGFHVRNGETWAVSFIGSDEPLQVGDAATGEGAVEALVAAAEALERDRMLELWPALALAALVVLAVRAWVAR